MRWENSVLIDAPTGRVWQLTLDITDWPSFSPTMRWVRRLDDGPLRVGSTARIKQPGQPAAVWTVTRIVDEREFTWQTRRMGVTMTGSHLLEPVGDRCRNTLVLDLTGPLSRPLAALIGGAIRRSLAAENGGFQARAAQPS